MSSSSLSASRTRGEGGLEAKSSLSKSSPEDASSSSPEVPASSSLVARAAVMLVLAREEAIGTKSGMPLMSASAESLFVWVLETEDDGAKAGALLRGRARVSFMSDWFRRQKREVEHRFSALAERTWSYRAFKRSRKKLAKSTRSTSTGAILALDRQYRASSPGVRLQPIGLRTSGGEIIVPYFSPI